ncbi:MAG TPA: DUF2191 domain-containing protein [Thermoanaerobaculia bacterium]|nr:DUF2191 domain-containing protein [Thermoanaerobaculia bacterium]
MRTTLTIDDHLARDLKEIAHRSGKSFKVVVNEALQAGLIAGGGRRRPKPYRLDPASLGEVRGDIDLDKALALADSLEDEALAGKIEQNK